MQQIQINVVPAPALQGSLRSAVLALCSDAYEEDFTRYLDLLSSAVHVLVTLDGKLVSHAAWVERELRAEGVVLAMKAAYIEAVATPLALQCRGYGSKALSALPPLLGEFDIAALSPSEVPFYERLGWELWKGPLEYIHSGQIVSTPDEEVMIFRLPKTPRDLDVNRRLSTDWRPGEVW